MKLPWDKKYLKIALHVILTAAVIYIAFLLIDSAAFVLTNMEGILGSLSSFVGRLFSVFAVVVIAFVIAYLLDPAADFFQRKYTKFMEEKAVPFMRKQLWKIPLYRKLVGAPKAKKKTVPKKDAPGKDASPGTTRTAGALIVYLIVLSVIAAIVIWLVRRIGGGQWQDIGEGIITWANGAYLLVTELYADLRVTLEGWGIPQEQSDMLSDLVNALRDFIRTIPNQITGIAGAAGSIIANVLIAVVVGFYFLRDKAHIIRRIKGVSAAFLPEKANRRIGGFLREANEVFAGYIRGQLTDALIMSVLFSIGLSIVGVPFAIPIGIFSGLSNIIPYFGAIVAFVISMAASLLSGDPSRALWAAIMILGLQQIDGMFIVPRVVGQKVELSPALVMISLAVGGNLFGVQGMVFAVPICALAKIIISRTVKRREQMKEMEDRAV